MIELKITPTDSCSEYRSRMDDSHPIYSRLALDGFVLDIYDSDGSVVMRSVSTENAIADFAPYSIPEFKEMEITISNDLEGILLNNGNSKGTIVSNMDSLGIPCVSNPNGIKIKFKSLAEYLKVYSSMGFKDHTVYGITTGDRVSVSAGYSDQSKMMENALLLNEDGVESLFVFDAESRGLGLDKSGDHRINNILTSLSGIYINLKNSGDSLLVSVGDFSDMFFDTPLSEYVAKLTGMTDVDLSKEDPIFKISESKKPKVAEFFSMVKDRGAIACGHNIIKFDLDAIFTLFPEMAISPNKLKVFDTLRNSTDVDGVRKQVNLVAHILAPKKKGLSQKLEDESHRSIVDCLSSIFLVASIRAKAIGAKSFIVEKDRSTIELLSHIKQDNKKYHDFISNFIGINISVSDGAPIDVVNRALKSLELRPDMPDSGSITF